jgi:hypothetical protein
MKYRKFYIMKNILLIMSTLMIASDANSIFLCQTECTEKNCQYRKKFKRCWQQCGGEVHWDGSYSSSGIKSCVESAKASSRRNSDPNKCDFAGESDPKDSGKSAKKLIKECEKNNYWFEKTVYGYSTRDGSSEFSEFKEPAINRSVYVESPPPVSAVLQKMPGDADHFDGGMCRFVETIIDRKKVGNFKNLELMGAVHGIKKRCEDDVVKTLSAKYKDKSPDSPKDFSMYLEDVKNNKIFEDPNYPKPTMTLGMMVQEITNAAPAK